MANALIGQMAPEITLRDENGKPFTIKAGEKGLPMAIFFFPTAGSYGCTREVCNFRDAVNENVIFKRTQCEVIGISGDTVEAQKKFVDENGLQYPLLSDIDGEAKKAFGVTKGLLGMSEGRTTFVADKTGKIVDVYDSVLNYNHHAKFVAKTLEQLE